MVSHLNCTALSQLESGNFFMYNSNSDNNCNVEGRMIKKTSVTDWAFMITTGHPRFNTTTEPRVYCNNSPDDTLYQTLVNHTE